MESLSDVVRKDFERALTDRHLMQMRIIQLALAGGVVLFAIVVAVMAFLFEPGDAEPDLQLAMILSAVNLFIFLTECPLGFFIPTFVFGAKNLAKIAVKGQRQPNGEIEMDMAINCVGLILNSMIIRTALFVSAAFAGLIFTLIIIIHGAAHAHPLFYANVIPAFILLGFMAMTFPTRDHVIRVFRRRIKKDSFA